MANQLKLIQTRIDAKDSKKLEKLRKRAGVLTTAEFLRQIVKDFIQGEEKKSRN